MKVTRTGDWAKARRMLAGSAGKLERAITTALTLEAHRARKQVVQGITKQAPGGQELRPPSPLTLAARQMKGRGGTKALLVSGDLRNSITVVVKGDEAFVGVLRKARGKDGQPLVNVAEVQEFGAGPIVIPMTPAMRRFLFALFRKAGEKPRGGSGRGVVVITIPARPFLRPVFEVLRREAPRRFQDHVAEQLGWGRM